MSRRACGSSPVVSSSRIAIFGLPTSASAIDSRCFCPPESLLNAVSPLAGQTEVLDQLLASRPGRGRTSCRGPAPRRPALRSGSSLSCSCTPSSCRISSAVARGSSPSTGIVPPSGRGARRRTRPWWSCRRRSGRGCRRSPLLDRERHVVHGHGGRRSACGGRLPRYQATPSSVRAIESRHESVDAGRFAQASPGGSGMPTDRWDARQQFAGDLRPSAVAVGPSPGGSAAGTLPVAVGSPARTAACLQAAAW